MVPKNAEGQGWLRTCEGLSFQSRCLSRMTAALKLMSCSQSQSYFKTGGLSPINSSWCQTPWGWRPDFFFQFNTYGHSPYATSSLTRGWVYWLQLLLALASAVILRSESRGTDDHILLSQIRDSPTWRARFPQKQDGPVIPPGTGFPFRCLLRLAGLRWRYNVLYGQSDRSSRVERTCVWTAWKRWEAMRAVNRKLVQWKTQEEDSAEKYSGTVVDKRIWH
jgi:hypothetical protein